MVSSKLPYFVRAGYVHILFSYTPYNTQRKRSLTRVNTKTQCERERDGMARAGTAVAGAGRRKSRTLSRADEDHRKTTGRASDS